MIILLVSFATCYAQEKQYTDQSDIESLKERVAAFWEARKTGDLLTLYEFEAVSVNGQTTLRQYVNKGGDLLYKNFSIVEIKIVSTDLAHALLEVEVVIPGLGKPIKSKFEDDWVKLDEKWYHLGRAHVEESQ